MAKSKGAEVPESSGEEQVTVTSERKRRLGAKGITAIVLAGVLVAAGGGIGAYALADHYAQVAAEERAVAEAERLAAEEAELQARQLKAANDELAEQTKVAEGIIALYGADFDGKSMWEVLDAKVGGESLTELKALIESLAGYVEAANAVETSDLAAVRTATTDIGQTVFGIASAQPKLQEVFLDWAESKLSKSKKAKKAKKTAATEAIEVVTAELKSGEFKAESLVALQVAIKAVVKSHKAQVAAEQAAQGGGSYSGGYTGGYTGGSGNSGGSGGSGNSGGSGGGPNSSYATKTGVIKATGGDCASHYGSGGVVYANYSSNIVIPHNALKVTPSDRGGGLWQVKFSCF